MKPLHRHDRPSPRKRGLWAAAVLAVIFIGGLALSVATARQAGADSTDVAGYQELTAQLDSLDNQALDDADTSQEDDAVSPAPSVQPEEIAGPADDELVPIEQYIPTIYVELKYATEDNITGQAVYDFDVPYLRYGTVKKLAQVQEALLEQGYSLKIWDGFRPTSAQFDLWEAMPDGRYIANPYRGYSDHSRGNCVDLTLVTASGEEIPMPTGFDDFTALADRDYSDVASHAAANVQILEDAMAAAGFVPYSAEWWHYTDEVDYDVVEDFEPAEQLTAVTVSAVGDCILATGYGFGYANTFEDYMDRVDGDLSYFFAGVYDILSADDLTIANAENVFTTATERADKDHQGSEAFWFKSDPSYAQIYAEGSVEAVSTANNHSHDYGEKGYQGSLEALADAGITTFGYDKVASYEVKGTTFALLSFNVWGPLEYGTDLEEMKAQVYEAVMDAREWADIVVTSFHWGEEQDTTANDDQIELAHYAVDCGADLVLGTHPHVLQEVEVYHGTVIAYSLGNFVYGGAQRPARDTMILSTTFYVDAETGQLAFSRHEEIAAYVYGLDNERNDYQPVLA